jgi:predicted oxidoreductase
MKTIPLGKSELQVPVIAVGCMRIQKLDQPAAEKFIKTALDLGANFFDHADVYGNGACEALFAKAIGMTPALREQMILQSKVGIRANMFDFSKEHILEGVNGSLKRLQTDYLDILLLHRPDALVEPEQVAEAFDILHSSGKVRYFGVSNQKPMQIELLRKYLHQDIQCNQLQLSIPHSQMISNGIYVNMENEGAIDRDGSILNYCRLNQITIQPWSPFQYGFFEGVFLDNPKFPELNKVINRISAAHGVSNTTIALAWLLRHPAKMQPVTGTMNINRLKDCVKAADDFLSREEWYEIFVAAGNKLP